MSQFRFRCFLSGKDFGVLDSLMRASLTKPLSEGLSTKEKSDPQKRAAFIHRVLN
jgi:hypothetical protein